MVHTKGSSAALAAALTAADASFWRTVSPTFGYMIVGQSCWIGYMLACKGSGIRDHASEPLLPPYHPCPSTFCERFRAGPAKDSIGFGSK